MRASVPAPHLLAAAFCAGLAAPLAVRPASVALVGAALTLAAVAVTAPAPRPRAMALAGVLLAAAWLWGSVRLDALDESRLERLVGMTALARLEITGPARRSEFAVRVPVRVVEVDRRSVAEPARLVLPPERAPPAQGAVVESVVRITRPRGDEGSGFDEAGYLARQGIHVILRAGWYRVVGRRGGLPGFADRLRARVATTMAPGLEGERRAVVAGVVLGEDEGLDQELRDRFRASGLYHLLAVSGQNIAYVVFGALVLAWVAGLPRWVGELGALSAVAGYVMAVGWQPSVVRAGIAGALASLAWLASRPRDRWYFLLVGAAVLGAWNPYSLVEPGFQLSFGAVAAIFVLVPRLGRRLEGYPLPRRLVEVLAVSAACGAATAPILWLHFGSVPVYSIVANAAAEPVVAPLLGLALGAAAVEPLLPEAAVALAWVNGWLAAYLAACARAFGGLPFSQISSLEATAALAFAALGVWIVVRTRARRARRLLAVVAMLAALAIAWREVGPRADPPPAPEGLRLTFLDVGQGDATLIEVPEGAVLVDQGPPEAHVAAKLAGLGVERLELLVMTHPSRDNIGGAEEILRRLPVGLVLDPDLPFENPFGEPALAEARIREIRVATARAGLVYRLGRLELRILWPDGRPVPVADDPNDHATVILLSYGNFDALLPADAESNVTEPLAVHRVELYKVGHHGSTDPGLDRLLARLRPRIAVISVGARNDYGHPTPSTLAALAAVPGLDVYRTDEDGTIRVVSDGLTFAIEKER